MGAKKVKETVTEVIDGDTIRTGNSRRKYPLRLANVDAPEEGEPGYVKATEALEKLVLDKPVTIEQVARDTYGRPVVKIKVGNKSVNKAMREMLKKSTK